MGLNLVFTACTSKMSTTFKTYNLAVFDQNSTKLVQGGPLHLRDFKNGQKLVYTACTSKMSTTLKAYISAIFSQKNLYWVVLVISKMSTNLRSLKL